jgi:hypothetical protein
VAITTSVPGLPLGLGLGLPRPVREFPSVVPLPEVYRATLSGSPALAVPISSVSLRRNLTGSSLSLVSPDASAAQIAALLARSGGTLTLWRGVRAIDGTEHLDVLLAAPLTGLRYDLGARSGSVILSADLTQASLGGQTRPVRGISYRNQQDGKRRVRAAVDSYLIPGDVADLGGGETLTIVEMTYSVDVGQSNMEIAE